MFASCSLVSCEFDSRRMRSDGTPSLTNTTQIRVDGGERVSGSTS